MFLLHVIYPSGSQRTLVFPSAFTRALVMITLSAQPLALQTEDR